MSIETEAPESVQAPERVKVWDVGVRAFHWLLVTTVAGALLTGFFGGKSLTDVHVILGTAIAVLIVWRLIWGFFGPTYARFSSFVCGPGRVLRYLGGAFRGEPGHYVGHNPAGGLMILALLVCLAAIVVTGVVVLGGVLKEGPVAAWTSFATGSAAKGIHELLAIGLLGLVALHVIGVIIGSRHERESLVRAMVTGFKRRRDEATAMVRVHNARTGVAVGLAVIVFAFAFAGIWELSALPAIGVPTGKLDPVYAKECGACHTAHHPSLAPKATWAAIMDHLDDHFGENASLDASLTGALKAYLLANSAEQYDTRAANRLRAPNAAEPMRITATRAWQRLHREIPDEIFKSKKVAGKVNCGACHGDADTGRFAPRNIHIPKETTR